MDSVRHINHRKVIGLRHLVHYNRAKQAFPFAELQAVDGDIDFAVRNTMKLLIIDYARS